MGSKLHCRCRRHRRAAAAAAGPPARPSPARPAAPRGSPRGGRRAARAKRRAAHWAPQFVLASPHADPCFLSARPAPTRARLADTRSRRRRAAAAAPPGGPPPYRGIPRGTSDLPIQGGSRGSGRRDVGRAVRPSRLAAGPGRAAVAVLEQPWLPPRRPATAADSPAPTPRPPHTRSPLTLRAAAAAATAPPLPPPGPTPHARRAPEAASARRCLARRWAGAALCRSAPRLPVRARARTGGLTPPAPAQPYPLHSHPVPIPARWSGDG
jgi:hypothetical protein